MMSFSVSALMLVAFGAVLLLLAMDTWSLDTRCDGTIFVGGGSCRLLGKEVGDEGREGEGGLRPAYGRRQHKGNGGTRDGRRKGAGMQESLRNNPLFLACLM
jgi:hypothetical protein